MAVNPQFPAGVNDNNLVDGPYAGNQVINQGDILVLSSGNLVPAALLTPDGRGNAAGNLADQLTVAANFAGVANSRKVATDGSGTISLSLVSTRYMAIAAGNYAFGCMVAANTTGGTAAGAISSTSVITTGNSTAAIGRIVNTPAVNATAVLVRLKSALS